MNIKTITSTEGVNEVDFGSGASRFYWFRNVGTTTVHVSGKADITAGSGGYVIEARGHEYGVVKTALKSRPWKWWGKCPWIDYSDNPAAETEPKQEENAPKTVGVKCKKVRLKAGTWNVRKLPSTDSTVIKTVKGGADINVADGFVYVPSVGGFISEKAIEM